MPIDPCREWLGIDAVDLSSPHLVLDVRPDEIDPHVIDAAASARLSRLEAISPGPFERAHAALVGRVTQARDEMLARARSASVRPPAEPPRSGLTPPPRPISAAAVPVWPADPPSAPTYPPPPVAVVADPPASMPGIPAAVPVPPVAAENSPRALGDWSETPRVRSGHGHRPRRAGGSVGLLVMLVSLAAVAAALATYFAVSFQLSGQRRADAADSTPSRMAGGDALAPWLRPAPLRRPKPPAPVQEVVPGPAPRSTPEELVVAAGKPPAVAQEPPRPPEAPAAMAPPEKKTPPPAEPPAEPAGEPRTDAAAVERALAQAYGEIRAGRFSDAEKAVDTARDAAADEPTLQRVERWRLLVTYAVQLAAYRDKAVSELAAKGGEVKVDGTVISVIELNATHFVYKERGQMKRPRRNAIPPRVVRAILTTWFAADGRPANDIYLGVQELLGNTPNRAAARAVWQRAAQRGEDVTALLALLQDPVLAVDRQE